MNAPGTQPDPAMASLSNVDPGEERYYEHLSRRWWDDAGPFWPLHRLNALRADYLRRTLCGRFGRDAEERLPLTGLRFLDVGCGGGILSESMARLGAEVHGIDVVPRNVEIARAHARGEPLPVEYEVATAAELGRRGVEYDAVLNMEVVEHVPDVAALVRDCTRLVRPGGVMVLATINRTALSWLFAIVGAEYVLGWLPRGTHRWRQFVKPGELQAMLENLGFFIADRVGVRINPVNRHFALSRITAVNYMLVSQRAAAGAAPVGLRLVS